jgi:hypothetical protein
MNNGQSSENPPTLSVSTAALKAARRLDQLAARPGVYRLLVGHRRGGQPLPGAGERREAGEGVVRNKDLLQ